MKTKLLILLGCITVIFSTATFARGHVNRLSIPDDTGPVIAVNQCNGEEVTLYGEVQNNWRSHTDRQGKVHFAFHTQLVNMVGEGAYGNTYRIVGNTQLGQPWPWTTGMIPFAGSTDPNDGVFVARLVVSNQMIPVGNSDAPKFMLHIRVNITVNANGQAVVATGFEPGTAPDVVPIAETTCTG